MPAEKAKNGLDHSKILLAIALFQKNALPVIVKQIRSLIAGIQTTIRALVKLCSANGRIRRVAVAKIKQLAGIVAFFMTQAAKWRRLIEFLAAKALSYAKRNTPAAPAPAPVPAEDPAIPAISTPQPTTTPKKNIAAATPEEDLKALAKYSNLDQLATRKTAPKAGKSKPGDKIKAKRRGGR